MSDRINKHLTLSVVRPTRSGSPSKEGDKSHAGGRTDNTSHQLGHQDRDIFDSTKEKYRGGQSSARNRPQTEEKIERPQSSMKGINYKRSRSPKSDPTRSEEEITHQAGVEVGKVKKNTIKISVKEARMIQKSLQRKVDQFLKENPEKKIESWGHYPLTKILETGECPYSSNRPLAWSTFARARRHFEKHLPRIGFDKPIEYTEYAESVLLRPISSSCPAFFSLEATNNDGIKNKKKTPPLMIKVYRFDKEKERIVIGDAKGQILTCFCPCYNGKNQSKYEWFEECLLEDTKRIKSNTNELSKKSEK